MLINKQILQIIYFNFFNVETPYFLVYALICLYASENVFGRSQKKDIPFTDIISGGLDPKTLLFEYLVIEFLTAFVCNLFNPFLYDGLSVIGIHVLMFFLKSIAVSSIFRCGGDLSRFFCPGWPGRCMARTYCSVSSCSVSSCLITVWGKLRNFTHITNRQKLIV